MVRTHLPTTELEREDIWLDAIEAGTTTTRDIAEDVGMTQRHVRRRVAAARKRREEGARDYGYHNRDDLDRFDHPYMELVTSKPEATPHDWITLTGQESSRDSGKYHIGRQVRSLTTGRVFNDPDDGESHPTSYEPDPSGLKGGVG